MLTKNGIHLLNANQLTNLVTKLENHFPGYWYSVSQKKNELTLSLGPSTDCLLDADRAWSLTKEGDSGIIVTIDTTDKIGTISTSELVKDLIDRVQVYRDQIVAAGTEFPPKRTAHRRHSPKDFDSFKKRHNRFLKEELETFEKSIVLREVYVGACTFSSDVSLRGQNANTGSHVDFSSDLTEAGTLRDALDEVLHEALCPAGI